MVGRTLTELRARLERLATPGGDFTVRCGRTGVSPAPVDGLAFPDRAAAVRATELAQRYRATLRRYDPRAPCYDFVVCERAGVGQGPAGRDWSTADGDLVADCHDVAGALFESLAAAGHDSVERAVMDRYLATAEHASRDRLCLELLTAMATALTDLLDRREQLAVLDAAASTFATDRRGTTPRAGLERLRASALVETVTVDRTGPVVHLEGYELAPAGGRLPTVPLTLALRHEEGLVPETARQRSDGGWQLALSAPPHGAPASAPIERAP